MADVFVSYSRRDADFVQRMASSLEERGKSVWIDTQGIADTEVFPQALRSAIEGSDAFLFVITPDSVASDFCEQEVTYARSLEKRIVPALRAPVPDPAIPEEIRHRNWIPFTEAEDVDASLDRVVRALDTDLAACKEHTRWLVKALEWDAEDRDRSFLLRGSELKAAESWLAGTSPEAEPAPTTVQSEYVLASRRAAARRQRTLVTASLVVAVVAVGLGVVALVPRNQAVSAGRTDRVQALAAESQNELSADPEVSVLLARQAVQTDPDPQAVAALRQAVDASAVRVALPTQSGRQCGYLGAPSLAYSPDGHRLAESLCTGEVVVADSGTGRILYRRHIAGQLGAVAYAPDGRTLAVGTPSGVSLLDPSTGAVVARLSDDAQPNALAYSPDGSLLAATTNRGTTLWDLSTGAVRFSFPGVNDNFSLAFTSDSKALAVGTGAGFTAVFDVTTGQTLHRLAPPAGQDISPGSSPNPVAVGGNLLAVAVNVNGPGDLSADIDLWNTTTWTFDKVLTPVTNTAVGAVAVSPDGQDVAVGNDDGSGGVWAVSTGEQLVTLRGQTAEINTIAFSPDGTTVAAVAEDGTARTYRAARLVPDSARTVVSTDQQNEGVVISDDGRLAASWDEQTPTSTVQVTDGSTGRVVFTLPATTVEDVSFSPDGRYLVVTDSSGGMHVADLDDHRVVVGQGWPRTCVNGGYPPAVSNDDKLVAVYTFCGQVTVGHLGDARPFENFNQHQQLSEIAFDPTGQRLALASWDSSVTVVDVATDRPVLELIGHTRGVTGVVYSRTGGYIITSSGDDSLRVWDATTGQLMQVDRDESALDDVSASPDGKWVAEENSDNQVRVWAVCPDCRDPSALLAGSAASAVSPLTPLEREAAAQAGWGPPPTTGWSRRSLRSVAFAPQELLELGGDLVPGGDVHVQPRGGRLFGVEGHLQTVDHVQVLGVGPDQLVDLTPRLVTGPPQRRTVEHQAGHGAQPFDEGGAGFGVGHGRHVVGDPGPQADDRHLGLAQGHLEGGLHPGRHFEGALHGAHPADQVGRLGRDGGGQFDRAGVGRGGGEGTQPDHGAHLQAADHPDHRFDEGGPQEVRLRPGQVDDVGSHPVLARRDPDGRPGQLGGDPVLQPGDGPPGPLVDEQLGVEGGHRLGGGGGDQLLDGRRRSHAGVDPTLETHHQHRCRQARVVHVAPLRVVTEEGAGVGAVHSDSTSARARWPSRTTWSANWSTPVRSPAAAPPT